MNQSLKKNCRPALVNNLNHQNRNNFDDFRIMADIPTYGKFEDQRFPKLVGGSREILPHHRGSRDKDGCLPSQSNYRCLVGSITEHLTEARDELGSNIEEDELPFDGSILTYGT